MTYGNEPESDDNDSANSTDEEAAEYEDAATDEFKDVVAFSSLVQQCFRREQQAEKRRIEGQKLVCNHLKRFREMKGEDSPLKKRLVYETLFNGGMYRIPEEKKVQTTPTSPGHPDTKCLFKSKCHTK